MAMTKIDGMVVVNNLVPVEADESLYGDVTPGAGFENVTARDVAIPYIRLLQAISGEVKKGPAKVAGAEEGDIYNSGTGEIVKGSVGITVIPCAFKKKWIQRGPRGADNKPGQYVATLDTEPSGIRVGRGILMANGDEASDVSDHYVVICGDAVWQKGLIRMASSQLKHSRFWLGLMQGIQWVRNGKREVPPMFSHTYHLTTATEPPKDGNTWCGWVIGKPVAIADRDLAVYAKEFYKAVQDGRAPVADLVEESSPAGDLPGDVVPF